MGEYASIKGQQNIPASLKYQILRVYPKTDSKTKIAILKHKYCLNRTSLTLDELKRIGGIEFVTIGSHTVTHPILTNCSYESQFGVNGVQKILSQWINKEIEYVAYPNGDFNEDTIEIAKNAVTNSVLQQIPGKLMSIR